MTDEQDVGTQVAIKFLRQCNDFGSRVHLLTAQILKAAIDTTTDTDDRKLLVVKIFSEFIAAVEDLGAMCIAIRHREDGVGLVFSFLTYGPLRVKGSPKTTLQHIFELLSQGEGLEKGLRLPSLEEIIQKFPLFANEPNLTLYREANHALAQAGAVFLAENQLLVKAYNKTKHGFVVVSDFTTFQSALPKFEDNTAWIVINNPDYDPSNPSETSVVQLVQINVENALDCLNRISTVRGALRVIAELTAVLLENGIISCADNKA